MSDKKRITLFDTKHPSDSYVQIEKHDQSVFLYAISDFTDFAQINLNHADAHKLAEWIRANVPDGS